jgi:hypothetical protein
MAEETIDAAIKACGLTPKHPKCQTMGLTLDGGHEWSPTMYIRLVQDFGLENEVMAASDFWSFWKGHDPFSGKIKVDLSV